VVSGHWLVVSG